MRPALLAGLVLALPAAAAPDIAVRNDARVPQAQLASILADFRDWGARVHAYYGVPERAVTLKLTREVPFGFYRDGVVMLPPSGDRQAMLEDWVHELTHHVLGRDSSFFFREGAATHTVDALFARDGRVPQGWPYFGKTCDQWVGLFARRGRLLPLAEMLAWPRYLGGSAEQDFRSWQIYLAGCSFVGWTIARDGQPGFRRAFAARGPAADPAAAEQAWRDAVTARKSAPFAPETVLPPTPRYRNYAERLRS